MNINNITGVSEKCMEGLRELAGPYGDLPHTERCNYAVSIGNLETLKWFHEQEEPIWIYTMNFAAEGGHIDILEWLHEQNCAYGANVCVGAARSGKLESIKWLADNNYPCHLKSCAYQAAMNGHAHVLEYLIEQGYELNEWDCFWALKHKQYDLLKWLLDKGCPCGTLCSNYAARKGDLKTLVMLKEYDCQFSKNIYTLVKFKSSPEVLEQLRVWGFK